MRKTLICMLALLMLLSAFLVACGGGDGGSETKPGESASQPESDKKPGGNSTESSDCVHEAVTDAAVEATCTTPGKTEGSHCAKCGKILVAQKAIPIEHLFVDGKCTRCGLETSKGLEYALNEDGNSYSVIGIGSCTDTDLVIPPTYEGKPVTSIGELAFKDCSKLTSVTIPNSIESIEGGAFYGCMGLTRVNISDIATWCKINFKFHSLYGGTSCPLLFAHHLYLGNTEITDLVIPDGITSIGDYAFIYCSGLTSVTIPDSVTSIGAAAFWNCRGLTSVTIGNGVTSIVGSAFADCRELTSITIPDSVTTIGEQAFWNCEGLTSVTIGNGVTSIGNQAFAGTAYYKDESNWENGVLYNGKCLISAKSSLSGSYDIKNGTVCIANNAFSGCAELTNITIPDSVTNIGWYAFSGCAGLTDITIPDSVTTIGHMAFMHCIGLTSVTIPDSVTSIGDEAFFDCSGLTSIAIPDSVTSIGYGTFYGCERLTSVTIPDGVTSIGVMAFSDCSALTGITIPDSVTSIGDRAFEGCAGLINIHVGSGNENYFSVDGVLFNKDQTTLICYPASKPGSSYSIPNRVTGIGYGAFSGCLGLKSITIPNSVTDIGDLAFKGCSGLTSIIIPDSVTGIGDGAFRGCSGLTSIIIPDSVTKVGNNAFNDTAYYEDESNWENDALYNGKYLIEVKDSISDSYIIKESTVCIADGAFSSCSKLTSVTIPDGVTSIGDFTFYDCRELSEVTIGNGVTSIGERAFGSCRNLICVTYNGTKEQWQAISKNDHWYDVYTDEFTVYCTDGEIAYEDA